MSIVSVEGLNMSENTYVSSDYDKFLKYPTYFTPTQSSTHTEKDVSSTVDTVPNTTCISDSFNISVEHKSNIEKITELVPRLSVHNDLQVVEHTPASIASDISVSAKRDLDTGARTLSQPGNVLVDNTSDTRYDENSIPSSVVNNSSKDVPQATLNITSSLQPVSHSPRSPPVAFLPIVIQPLTVNPNRLPVTCTTPIPRQPVIASVAGNELFYIERSSDQDVVVYRALRKGNVLYSPFIDIYQSNTKDRTYRKDIPENMRNTYFGATVTPSGKTYNMIISAMPSKPITLHLKKTGTVIAKTTVNGKEARIHKIRVQIDNMIGIPTVRSLTIHGEHKKKMYTESMDISEFIRNFDVSKIIPDFLSSFIG